MATPPPQDQGPKATPWSGPGRGCLLAALLALASVIAKSRSQVIELIVEPIKTELALNDTVFGALQRSAFG